MQTIGQEDLEIYASRWQNGVSAVLKTLASAVFVWLTCISYSSNVTFAAISGMAALFLALSCAVQLRHTFGRQPSLILTPEAIIDQRVGKSIPWSGVRQVTLVEETLNQFVEYKLVMDVETEHGRVKQSVPVDLLEKEPRRAASARSGIPRFASQGRVARLPKSSESVRGHSILSRAHGRHHGVDVGPQASRLERAGTRLVPTSSRTHLDPFCRSNSSPRSPSR